MAARLRKGDRVIVLAGRDRNGTGEILKVFPRENRALVSGVNRVVRRVRPQAGREGGNERREAPVHLSNLALLDPGDGRPTRVGFRFLEDGRKVRFSRRTGELIDG